MPVRQQRHARAVLITAGALLALLNAAVVSFYALYRAADEWAVDRSERTGSFDPSYLLPHGDLLWLVATGAVVLLIAFDVAAVIAGVTLRRHTAPPPVSTKWVSDGESAAPIVRSRDVDEPSA